MSGEGDGVDKEQIHDEQICPLMAQIIAICKSHGIACFATFALPSEDNEGLYCTTCLPDGDGVFPDVIKDCEKRLHRKPEFFAFTITKT